MQSRTVLFDCVCVWCVCVCVQVSRGQRASKVSPATRVSLDRLERAVQPDPLDQLERPDGLETPADRDSVAGSDHPDLPAQLSVCRCFFSFLLLVFVAKHFYEL